MCYKISTWLGVCVCWVGGWGSALLLISLPTVNVLQVSTLTPDLAGSVKHGVQRGEVSDTVIPGMALTSH